MQKCVPPTRQLAEDDRTLVYMNEIDAILFDLGNTLSRSASLSKSLVDIASSSIVEKLNLSTHQLQQIGVEIEQEIGAGQIVNDSGDFDG